jgi:hypothetical protein
LPQAKYDQDGNLVVSEKRDYLGALVDVDRIDPSGRKLPGATDAELALMQVGGGNPNFVLQKAGACRITYLCKAVRQVCGSLALYRKAGVCGKYHLCTEPKGRGLWGSHLCTAGGSQFLCAVPGLCLPALTRKLLAAYLLACC